MSNAKNKHRNIRKGGHVKTVRYHDLLRAKRTQNPLSGLNPAKVRRLYELYREGKYADVQLAWDALEEYDDMLGTVLERRQSALGEMEWDVLIDARAVGATSITDGSLSTPTQGVKSDLQALAEAQQDYITRRLREVENLSDAIKWLGLANFRRYSALEVLPMATGERWLPIHHWLLCRPALEGSWCYNEAAETSCARVEPIDMSAVILREVARPIDLVAMFLISAKEAAIDGWDSFLEVFGNPALFFKMPPGTSDERRDEYASIIKEISSDGAGVYPDGGEIHTVETSAANADAFSSRAEWCDKALVRRATGGLLTVLAESGSGTLAGSAHMEAFRQIAANDAISIAECINRQYVRRRIAAEFPGEPVLVYFTLEAPAEVDKLKEGQFLATLASAGWHPSDEAVSEMLGIEVKREQEENKNVVAKHKQPVQEDGPGQPPVVNGRGMPGFVGTESRSVYAEARPSETPGLGGVVANASNDLTQDDIAEAETPLNDGELAALRALGAELNPAQIAADADYMTREMMAGLEEPDEENESEGDVVANFGTSAGAYKGWENRKGANMRKQKGGRGNKGNPKNPTTKSNTPLKAAPGAKAQATVDAMEHALQKTAQKGGQVQDAVKIGDSSLTITSGVAGDKSNDYKGGKGSVHQFEKHGKGGKGKEQTSFRKVAKAAVLGDKSKDREKDTVLSDHHTTQAVYANKPKHTADFISGYKRKKPKSGTRAN